MNDVEELLFFSSSVREKKKTYFYWLRWGDYENSRLWVNTNSWSVFKISRSWCFYFLIKNNSPGYRLIASYFFFFFKISSIQKSLASKCCATLSDKISVTSLQAHYIMHLIEDVWSDLTKIIDWRRLNEIFNL